MERITPGLPKLSERLLAIAALVPGGAKVADIGTDHALLPCYLLGAEKAVLAIGTDVHQGPYERARQTVAEYGMPTCLEVRLGDGLKILRPGEVDTVVIAGMGGTAISKILAESPAVVDGLRNLILQPMTNPEAIRLWLWEHGWVIAREELVFEDRQYYQIIAAVFAPAGVDATASGDSAVLSDIPTAFAELSAAYGPLLIKNRHPLLPGFLERELTAMQAMLGQLAKSTRKDGQLRYREFAQRVEKIKELRKWL